MVLLRAFAAGLIILQAGLIFSQDYTKVIKAFETSYKLENQKKLSEAIKTLLVVYDEKGYEVNVRLGWLYYQAGKFEESVSYYNKAIVLMPYAVEPHWGIALPLDALKRTDDLIPHYKKILEINPDNSVALYRMGMIHYYKKEYTVAEKYFDKVINLYPFDYDGLVMAAWTKLQLKNTREAKILFNKALMRMPSGASALEGLALLK